MPAPANFFRLNTGHRQRERMCCAVSVVGQVIFLLSVKADHRPVGNNQVAAIFAVMLGGDDALEELSLLVDFAAKQCGQRFGASLATFTGWFLRWRWLFFLRWSCPIFASIMCALSIMNRFMTCVIA
jgi:hypothetical protein